MDLSSRAVRSGLWMTVAHWLAMAILLVRTIALARLLPIETFGVYALAMAIVGFASVLARCGLDGALLHRGELTRTTLDAAPVHFSLHLMLSIGVFGCAAALALGFAQGTLLIALLALLASRFALSLTLTPQVLLYRRVSHQRIAVLQVCQAVATTLLSLALAAHSATLWSLLAIDIAATVVALAVYYGWRPVWRPAILWRRELVGYFLGFGLQHAAGQLLQQAWQRIDKLATGAFFGHEALGLYSRAYGHGRQANAMTYRPLGQVVASSLAALKEDRKQLSTAVSNIAAVLFRATCCVAGAVTLAAPELVQIIIGEKWLPMVPAFQVLLLTFTLNAIMLTLSHLMIGLGRPGVLARMHFLRLSVLALAMAVLGPLGGIVGIACAVTLSVVAGLIMMIYIAGRQIELPLMPLMAAPVISLAIGGGSAVTAAILMPVGADLWASGIVKVSAFLAVYLSLLFAIDGRRLISLLSWAREAYRSPGGRSTEQDGTQT